MKRRKYLLYTYAFIDGGAERVWATLASELARRGHDVIFVVDFDGRQDPFSLHPAVRRVTLGGSHFNTVRRLAGLLRKEQPDIAYAAVAGSDLKLLAARVLSRGRCGVVISYHGLIEYQSGLLSWLTYASAPLLTRMADKTICVSHGLRRAMIKRWKAAQANTICVYNPVVYPDAPASVTREQLRARDNRIIAMGRLVPEKGFTALIEALARMKTPDATLTILGDGPERETLEALATQKGVSARVHFAGFQKNIWTYLDDAKCFAHGAHSEAFGLVVAEALARGLPVVAVRSDGPEEILSDPSHGSLIDFGDIDGLAAALDNAMHCPGDPAPRIRRAQDFSMEAGVSAYEAVADSVLAARG
jgi:glycosyltransferase involved in cell wall biosynthesis